MNRPISELGRRCLAGAQTFWQAGLDFVYPQACPMCGCDGPGDGKPRSTEPELCRRCRLELVPDIEDWCVCCGAPVGPHLDTTGGCMYCREERFAFETVLRLGVYEGQLRSATLRSKEPGGFPLAAALADLLWQNQLEGLRQAEADRVVSVPQHWTRRIRRGHNASESLAEVLARRLQVDFAPDILSKARMTPPQTSLTPTARRKNLRGAFRARGRSVLRGETVLLVDDVLTTGATAHEASKVLRGAGARQVIVAVLARGLGQSSGV